MKLNRSNQSTRAHHKFDLAGWPATIRADGYFRDLGIITTSIRLKGIEPISGCFIGLLTRIAAGQLMKQIQRERKRGALLPDAKAGHVVDVGFADSDPTIFLLCLATGLNPRDCTDFDYVNLTVRAAAMALARKLTKQQAGKSPLAKRSKPVKSFDPFGL